MASSNVYSKLYDLVEQRLAEYGEKPIASKEAFRYMTETRLGICDGSRLRGLSDEDFLDIAYLGLLKRLPDDTGKAAWQTRMRVANGTYRRELLRALRCSQEYVANNNHLTYNCYEPRNLSGYLYLATVLEQSRGVRRGGIYMRVLRALNRNASLRERYLKLPPWMQRLGKRLLGKG